MNPRFLLPMALGVAALAAAAPPAYAAAAPKITAKYTYRVELAGKQTTTWSLDHVGAGPAACDMDQTGSGKEVVRFSSRPTMSYTFDGLSQPYFFQKKGTQARSLSLPLRGTITRQGSVFTQPLPPGTDNCPDGGSSWPYLLKHPTESYVQIGRQLPYEDLFGQGRNIIIATGTDRNTSGDLRWTTRLRWELSFTRIRKEALTKGS